ncbi:hypothetical protein ACFFMN_08405 [Planobispora siamensis]|uniref:Uncharacterized protein n=1 Tax=Planobispora siamensis TaxID=936338 RepID=A0A8J3WII6_9ACTN|nr:hypothetical protein [Planobispora siamensis]GIH90515.1 hypothetical protein Psi01_11450 [Planobispora siamensis]
MARKHPMAQNPPGKPGSESSSKSSKGTGSKASKAITITTIGIVSLGIIAACAADDDYEEVGADCVDLSSRQPDGSYTIVDDDYCDETRYRGSHGAYGWYYGGTRAGVRVAKGTTVKPSDVTIVTRKGTVIQRGGFGGRGSSSS